MVRLESQDTAAGTKISYSKFFERLSRATARVLLLDYDGTLAPFCMARDEVKPYPAVLPLLTRIRNATRTRIVLVSGRSAHEAAGLLGLKQVEVWGCHGWERLRANGTYEIGELDERTREAIAAADKLLMEDRLGDLLEFKPTGIAVHWRGVDAAAQDICKRVEVVWSKLPNRERLATVKFDGGIEIRAMGRTKGDVVRTILSEAGPDSAVAYLGDDSTDEDAFVALAGQGLSVLVHYEYHPTRADVWIRPPEGLLLFLADWVTHCGGA